MNMYLLNPDHIHTWDIPCGRDVQSLIWLLTNDFDGLVDDWWLTILDLVKAGF